MKRTSALAVAVLGAAIAFGGISTAFAEDSHPSNTSTVFPGGSGARADLADAARHVINQNFQYAVLKAKNAFDAAMKSAVTAEAKAAALAARRFSVSSAIAARQNAISALGKTLSSSSNGSKPDRSKR